MKNEAEQIEKHFESAGEKLRKEFENIQKLVEAGVLDPKLGDRAKEELANQQAENEMKDKNSER